tara:strand:- start:214 stop:2466 length:2253 start_codon:yes stop_codon:yes gene_type:complete
MNKTQEFYDVLFDANEHVCFGATKYDTQVFPVDIGLKEAHSFFTVNPIKAGTTRADYNVSAYRNLMFEIDEDTERNPIPKEDQITIIKKSKLPLTTLLWSGGKSFHSIVSIADVFVEDKAEYQALWKAIASILNRTAEDLGYSLKFDAATKNPSRFTRTAGAVRLHIDKENEIQKVAKVNRRIAKSEILEWLKSYDVEWSDYLPKPVDYSGPNTYSDARTQEKIDFVLKYRMQNMTYDDGKKVWQYTFARQLRNTGLDQSEIETAIRTECDVIDARLVPQLRDICNWNKHSDDEKVYVWSMDDKRKFAQEQERLEKEAIANKITTEAKSDTTFNGDIVDVNVGGVHNYIRVGTKYYRADGSGIDLWDKQTLKDDFGAHILRDDALRKFRGFINEPSYLERIEHVTKIFDSRPYAYYNKHWYPSWELTKGEFPTTLKLLDKVGRGSREDRLEMLLDWIQLFITKPKQRTRALVLTGPPETGKDTFMEWLVDIVTNRNGIILEGAEVENPFNSHWSGKHLVCLNEVSFDLKDKKTKERLKNLLTSEMTTVEGKGDQQYQIDNHTKVIMATNNMHDFMSISDSENRYVILEMPELRATDKDPDFKKKLKKEKSAFLNWIINERSLWRTEKAGRFWHSDEECDTQAGRNLKKNTKSGLYDELEDILTEKFRTPPMQEEDEYSFRIKSLGQKLRRHLEAKGSDKKYADKAIKLTLLKEFDLPYTKTIKKDAFNGNVAQNVEHFTVTRVNLGLQYG